MGIAIMDAAGLAKKNKAVHQALIHRHALLQERCASETEAQEKERRSCQIAALEPFCDAFMRIKNIDLAELASFDDLPAGALPNAELRRVRLSATGMVGALAGGAGTGAAAGAVTFAAVGAFATASTGAAISGLSGAAATSATMAWLGGGSVATGGGGIAAGTTVMTGLVAAPVVVVLAGFLEYKGRQQLRQQREIAATLAKATAEFELEKARAEAVLTRSKQVRSILHQLRTELVDRLPSLELLVGRNDDYATYSRADRRLVAEAASLATTVITVMSARFVDDKGLVTDLSADVIKDAKLRLQALQAA